MAGPIRTHATFRVVQGSSRPGFWTAAAWAVIRRPALWLTALRQCVRLAAPGWWRRPPFLPLPDQAYLRFRMETAYGARGVPQPEDLVGYLEWCRARRRAA